MYMSNTKSKRKYFKNNPAEMDRNGSKAYKVPLQ